MSTPPSPRWLLLKVLYCQRSAQPSVTLISHLHSGERCLAVSGHTSASGKSVAPQTQLTATVCAGKVAADEAPRAPLTGLASLRRSHRVHPSSWPHINLTGTIIKWNVTGAKWMRGDLRAVQQSGPKPVVAPPTPRTPSHGHPPSTSPSSCALNRPLNHSAPGPLIG